MDAKTHIRFTQDYGTYRAGDVADIERSGIGIGLAQTFVDWGRAEWVEDTKAKAVKGKNVRNKAMSASGGE
jgi:hypothetical protein